MLQDKAMLANLHISRWSAAKTDKKVTEDVIRANGAAKDSGSFRKELVDKAYLKPLQTHESTIRAYHRKKTLLWDDDGPRVLPQKLYLEYTDQMRQFRLTNESLVRDLLAVYPQLLAYAPKRLGSMYDPKDFPSITELKDKHSVKVSIKAIDNADDFRVAIGDEALAQVRADIREETDQKFQRAIKDLFKRIHVEATRLSETLHREDPPIFETLVSNPKELVALIPHLNLTDDAKLEECRAELDYILPYSADSFKKNPELRARVAGQADALLEKLAPFV